MYSNNKWEIGILCQNCAFLGLTLYQALLTHLVYIKLVQLLPITQGVWKYYYPYFREKETGEK